MLKQWNIKAPRWTGITTSPTFRSRPVKTEILSWHPCQREVARQRGQHAKPTSLNEIDGEKVRQIMEKFRNMPMITESPVNITDSFLISPIKQPRTVFFLSSRCIISRRNVALVLNQSFAENRIRTILVIGSTETICHLDATRFERKYIREICACAYSIRIDVWTVRVVVRNGGERNVWWNESGVRCDNRRPSWYP